MMLISQTIFAQTKVLSNLGNLALTGKFATMTLPLNTVIGRHFTLTGSQNSSQLIINKTNPNQFGFAQIAQVGSYGIWSNALSSNAGALPDLQSNPLGNALQVVRWWEPTVAGANLAGGIYAGSYRLTAGQQDVTVSGALIKYRGSSDMSNLRCYLMDDIRITGRQTFGVSDSISLLNVAPVATGGVFVVPAGLSRDLHLVIETNTTSLSGVNIFEFYSSINTANGQSSIGSLLTDTLPKNRLSRIVRSATYLTSLLTVTSWYRESYDARARVYLPDSAWTVVSISGQQISQYQNRDRISISQVLALDDSTVFVIGSGFTSYVSSTPFGAPWRLDQDLIHLGIWRVGNMTTTGVITISGVGTISGGGTLTLTGTVPGMITSTVISNVITIVGLNTIVGMTTISGIFTTTGIITLTGVLSIFSDFVDNVEEISIFPNPIINQLTLDIVQDVEIWDIQGNCICRLKKGKQCIDTKNWPAGIYLLKIEKKSYKIIKEWF